MVKKIILFILTVGWMMTIFALSGQEANESSVLSRGVVQKIIDNIPVIKNYSPEKKAEICDEIHGLVRKIAHFGLYLILGILVYLLCIEFGLRHAFWIAALICMLYAATDETHQLFVAGRSGEISDVCIDTSGAVCGIILVKLFKCFAKKYTFLTKNT